MAYETIHDRNITEVAQYWQYAADIVPIFIPLVLFAIFIITMLGTYFSQRRTTGRGDMISSFAVAGIITAISATLLSLIDVVPLILLVPVWVIAFIGIIILFTAE